MDNYWLWSCAQSIQLKSGQPETLRLGLLGSFSKLSSALQWSALPLLEGKAGISCHPSCPKQSFHDEISFLIQFLEKWVTFLDLKAFVLFPALKVKIFHLCHDGGKNLSLSFEHALSISPPIFLECQKLGEASAFPIVVGAGAAHTCC